MGISPKQFEALQARTSGAGRPRRKATSPPPTVSPRPASILGIDPSLRGTGFGVIRLQGPSIQAVMFGTIKAPASWPKSRCLAQIAATLRDVLRQHRPEVCVLEGLFFAQNLKTALVMGEARGAALATIAEAGLPIFEIAPRKMKQAIVGYGAARKEAVARMVQRMLQLQELPGPDAADALALALAHAHTTGRPGPQPPRSI